MSWDEFNGESLGVLRGESCELRGARRKAFNRKERKEKPQSAQRKASASRELRDQSNFDTEDEKEIRGERREKLLTAKSAKKSRTGREEERVRVASGELRDQTNFDTEDQKEIRGERREKLLTTKSAKKSRKGRKEKRVSRECRVARSEQL